MDFSVFEKVRFRQKYVFKKNMSNANIFSYGPDNKIVLNQRTLMLLTSRNKLFGSL